MQITARRDHRPQLMWGLLTTKPIDPPPSSGRPTSAQLKADIDSGRTGDKVGVFDPASRRSAPMMRRRAARLLPPR